MRNGPIRRPERSFSTHSGPQHGVGRGPALHSPAVTATRDQTLGGLPATFAGAEGQRRPRPVLFVHGFLGHHHQFDGWLRAFSSAGFDAYAMSLRGRLGSPPEGARGASLDDFVKDVLGALGELDDAVLVGHSLGGLVCVKAAAAVGTRRPLVLLAPGPERPYVPAPGLLPALPWLMPRVLPGRAFRAPFWVVDQIALNRVPVEERRGLHEAMVSDSGRAYRTFLLGAGADRSRITGPVLVIAGEDDRVVPLRTARAMARRFGAEFRVRPGHAHWLLAEPGWEAIAQDVIAWLGQVE